MPYPRHLLQSVEIPNVVQVRASGDNVPGTSDNWLIGESDLLIYALGAAPFKVCHAHAHADLRTLRGMHELTVCVCVL